MNSSTMFLRNITCIDHAYVNDRGLIVGGSKHQQITVTGQVDDTEQVVVDFSNIKKFLKAAIDDKETGFDHKLWIYTNYSACEWVVSGNKITIHSGHFRATLPRNAVRIIEGDFYSLNKNLGDYLLTEAKKHYGNGITEINVITTDDTFSHSHYKDEFTYTHGLKNSTSWGCQNPCHGHYSFLEVYPSNYQVINQVINVLHQMSSALNGKVLIYRDNIINETDHDFTIGYCTDARGEFSVTYQKTHPHKFFDTETTIENIVSAMAEEFKEPLAEAGIKQIYISEGLSKGACKKIGDE